MPKFHNNLMGIGPLFDYSCRILLEETVFTVFSKDNTVFLKGYRKKLGANLWRLSLCPDNNVLEQYQTGPVALSANNLPSV